VNSPFPPSASTAILSSSVPYLHLSSNLAPLCLPSKPPFLSFQSFAASFSKSPGWGVSHLPSQKGTNVQSKTSKSASALGRCQHLTPAGRQCCSPVAGPQVSLSARHASAQPNEFVDFGHDLTDDCGDFQKAQQMNHSLIALYRLVAQGRISPRQGAVLGYIGSLVLRSLKSIDYDNDRFLAEDECPVAQSSAAAQPPTDAAVTKRAPVGPGREPLPETANEFALQAMSRKPN